MDTGKGLLDHQLKVINVGLELFALTFQQYDVPVVHLDWRPPAGGDPHLSELLQRLKPSGAPANRDGKIANR